MITPETGYDPDLLTTYEARHFVENGHFVQITEDRYGVHCRIDEGIAHTFTSQEGCAAYLWREVAKG